MRHLVVGAGEVGTAVRAVLARAHETDIRDIDPVNVTAEMLHICIPWSDRFIETVREYAQVHDAGLVVVHSTVPVGTCDSQAWVHSPIRGRHPHLAASLLAFVKHVGGGRAGQAAEVFAAAGVPVQVHERAAETEAGKLWELVQFGLQVRVEQEIHAWCEQRGLDPDVVYRHFAASYNAGYAALDERRFVRPVLDHVPGPIGGHCVSPGARMLDHPLADVVAGS